MTFIKHTIRKPLNDLDLRDNKIAEDAQAKGLIFGAVVGGGYGKPAIGGNTFAVKDTLKANGAKFNGASKVWVFETINQLITAIAAI